MGTLKRHYEENCVYFVITVTHRRQAIFSNGRICKILLVAIEYFKLLLDYKIFAYCIMPDHMHLIVQPMGKYTLSYIMQMIKGNFARKYNKLNSQSGKIWQEGFLDTGIRNGNELLAKIEYMHNNPVRARSCLTPDQYAFSSYRYYFNNGYGNTVLPEIDKLDI